MEILQLGQDETKNVNHKMCRRSTLLPFTGPIYFGAALLPKNSLRANLFGSEEHSAAMKTELAVPVAARLLYEANSKRLRHLRVSK